jgi:hypothetical protein
MEICYYVKKTNASTSSASTEIGLQAVSGNEEREAAHHESESHRAAECLKDNISIIDVECYYLKFNGVWAPEAGEMNLSAAI